jgi:hypothetical protein
MRRRGSLSGLGVGLVSALLAGCAHTEICPLDPPPPNPAHNFHTKGCPQCIAPWAKPSETKAYIGYYVGGGSPCHGSCKLCSCAHPPAPGDGTWGWDYQGCLLPRKVYLWWWHKYQGGTGAYRTDGPHLHLKIHGSRPKDEHEDQEHEEEAEHENHDEKKER